MRAALARRRLVRAALAQRRLLLAVAQPRLRVNSNQGRKLGRASYIAGHGSFSAPLVCWPLAGADAGSGADSTALADAGNCVAVPGADEYSVTVLSTRDRRSAGATLAANRKGGPQSRRC